MLEIYVIFMLFAIHGCDNVLEECFSKLCSMERYPRSSIELKDSGDK